MLELPRELLARAELPLRLLEPLPRALPPDLELELGDTLRLPTLSPPPPEEGRLALLSPAPPAELRSLARGCCPREEASRVLACALFPP
jgi:hypothetical protein